jgi:hypothetical protein
MSENITSDGGLQDIVAGTAEQPYQKQEPNYDEIEAEASEAVDSGLEDSEEMSAEGQIDQAQKDGKISKEEAKQLKKTLKIKVDGQELEETIDFDDEESLKRYIQKSKAFDKRNNEYVSYKSQVDKLLEMLEKDPAAALAKLGHDVDKLAESHLSRKIEELKKSPEQIEREKMEKELQDLREEKKRIEEEKSKAEMERLRNESAQQIENEISEALGSANSVLPKKNPVVLQRIAQTMLMAMNNGYPEVTAKDVIPLVEKQWKQELNDLFSVLPEDTLEMLVGKQNLERHRKKYLANKRSNVQTATAKQIVKDTGIKKEIEGKPYNPKEAKAKFKRMFSLD